MSEIIIADTSCLIILNNSGQLDLLRQLFAEIVVTPEVANEFGLPLPAWVACKRPETRSARNS